MVSSMSLALILFVGSPNSPLLECRNLFYRSAGYSIIPAFSIESAIREFEDGDFDLVLLDHTLAIEDRERLSHGIRELGSQTPIVPTCEDAKYEMDGGADPSKQIFRTDPISILSLIREALLRSRRAGPLGNATRPRLSDFPAPTGAHSTYKKR
jgi:hypothetical protein